MEALKFDSIGLIQKHTCAVVLLYPHAMLHLEGQHRLILMYSLIAIFSEVAVFFGYC